MLIATGEPISLGDGARVRAVSIWSRETRKFSFLFPGHIDPKNAALS